MWHVTGLTRTIDFRYQSNRLAVLVTIAAGLVGLAVGEDPIAAAISMAGAAFLGWAIAREIDPDRPISGSVAAPVATVVAWIDLERGHAPALGALYLTMAAARVISRSTGRVPTTLDLIVHLALVGWLSTRSMAWVAGVAFAVVVVLDTRLKPAAPPSQLWWGAMIGVVATLAAGLLWEPPTWVAPATREWIPMVMGLAGAAFLLRLEIPHSPADDGSEILAPRRVLMARLAVVATAIVTALLGGAAGLAAFGPAWAALGVAGVVRIVSQPA